MKECLHKLCHFPLALALAISTAHCGKTSFDSGATPKGTAAIIPTATSNDKDVEAQDSDIEVASEPVAVGGAFLTCALASTQSTQDEAAVQCEFSSQGLDSSRAQNLLYAFATGGSRLQTTAIAPAREEFINDGARQVWSWTFYFARNGIQEGWIYVDIQDGARVKDALIKADVAIPSVVAALPSTTPTATPTPTPTPEIASAPAMFQFNSGPQKLGDDGAGIGVETGCGSIDTPTIAMARARTYAVTLSAEASLNIVLSNLCGVGTGQTNTVGSFTTATLRNASNIAVFQFVLTNQAKLTYTSVKIPAGVYSLVITPASRNGALNDFVYSNLLVEGAGITVK